MRDRYIAQLRMLIGVLPTISTETVFALKGGTAINLFYRDLPRLSVDIDLTYLPLRDREGSLRDIDEALDRIVEAISGRHPSLDCRRIRSRGQSDTRVLVRNQSVEVKIETSPVARGTVDPPVKMETSPSVIERFGFGQANVVSFDDLYAGKLVAALDRQHPRDLFDIKLLYENEGITTKLFNVFLVYLAGSRRPMHELLAPRNNLSNPRVDTEFEGMTREPVPSETLVATQTRLHADIQSRLRGHVAAFLLSLHDAEPKFDLLGLQRAQHLPAVKWKVRNLERLKLENPEKHAQQRDELTRLFK